MGRAHGLKYRGKMLFRKEYNGGMKGHIVLCPFHVLCWGELRTNGIERRNQSTGHGQVVFSVYSGEGRGF